MEDLELSYERGGDGLLNWPPGQEFEISITAPGLRGTVLHKTFQAVKLDGTTVSVDLRANGVPLQVEKGARFMCGEYDDVRDSLTEIMLGMQLPDFCVGNV